MKQIEQQDINICVDSLEALRIKKIAIREKLDNSEEKLSVIWNKMFREQSQEELASPTKRFMAFVSSSAGMIDGAIMGWKLYRKFGGKFRLFK